MEWHTNPSLLNAVAELFQPTDNDPLLHAMARESHMELLGQRNALGPTDGTTPHRPHPSYVLGALLGMRVEGNPHLYVHGDT